MHPKRRIMLLVRPKAINVRGWEFVIKRALGMDRTIYPTGGVQSTIWSVDQSIAGSGF
jgi:hypothetical protein